MAITPHAALNAMPENRTAGIPNRLIRRPAKKDGANMPTRCHWMMLAPSSIECWHPTAASGAAVITNIITTPPMTLLAKAASEIGWRNTVQRLRAGRGAVSVEAPGASASR